MKQYLMLRFAFAVWLTGLFMTSLAQPQTQSQVQSTTTPMQVQIKATNVTAQSVLVNIRIPGSAGDVKIHLNGREVSSRFSAADCYGATCETATLAEADGFRVAKNVLSVNAGSGMTGRLRFDGISSSASPSTLPQLKAMALTSPQAQPVSGGITSPFLPPTLTLKTLYNGGWNGQVDPTNPWFIVGTQGYPSVQPANCSGSPIYMAVVLDRQTLVEKTAAPEASPQCFANSAALKTYLSGLNKAGATSDLVILASNQNASPDPGLDLTDIGGSIYLESSVPGAVYPAGIMAIGVPGATPQSAYEQWYSLNKGYEPTTPFANGTLQEDAYGNYNFQSSEVFEFTVSPNDPANLSPNTTSVITTKQPTLTGTIEYDYLPPTGNNGFWLLTLSRNTLTTYPYSCAWGNKSPDGSVQYVPNCGTFYNTGSSDASTSTAAFNQLTSDISNINTWQMAFLTTVGQPVYAGSSPNVFNVGGFNGTYGGPSNGFTEFANALSAFGAQPNLVQYLFNSGDAYTLITSPGMGGPLNGNSVESTTHLSAQGQSGFVHGIMQRNLNGLFTPQQTNQESQALFVVKGGNKSPEFALTEVAQQQPVDWPSSSQTTLLTAGGIKASSIPGQVAAYRYLSYVLLNIYQQGVTGSHLDDIHYFFTGSYNTAINYHTYDPISIQWPNPATVSGPYVYPCATVSNNTCTVTIPQIDSNPLVFTQNDFLAVQSQLRSEIIYLTNTLQFLVTGSNNMKTVIAGGSTNAGLALTGAASTILGSKLQPPPPQTVVKTSWQNIVSMIGGVSSLLSAVPGLGTVAGVIADGSKAATIFGGVTTAIGGAASIAAGAGQITSSSTSSSLPSAFATFSSTIGSLAQGSLQGQLSSGFDVMTDSITSDWGRLSTIGPMTVDSNNLVFFSPDQAAQNVAIQALTQGASRSFYLALLPSLGYRIDYWQGVEPGVSMGYYDEGAASCYAYYLTPQTNPTPAPAGISASFPSLGRTPQYFSNNFATQPVDSYVIAGTVTGAGGSHPSIATIDPQLAASLFTSSGLNLPVEEFVVPTGPLSGSFQVASSKDPGSHQNDTICAANLSSGVGAAPPTKTSTETPTITTLTPPATSVLGQDLALSATVTSNANPVTKGSMYFVLDGTYLPAVPITAQGTASMTIPGASVALGNHTLQADYSTVAPYAASESKIATVSVYGAAPGINLSTSAASMDVSYGLASSPITLQLTSLAGMAGTINLSCTGLPLGMSCNFHPAQVSLHAGGVSTASLTITANAVTLSSFWIPWVGLLMLPLLFVTFRRMQSGRRHLPRLASIFALSLLATLYLSGCSRGSTSPSSNTLKETGTKTISINATSGNTTSMIPVQVNIQ
ncbi:Ig-like domain-containing protein [Edaphobacter aggregans]|uniref:Ig-like domain-containing protein n=1 Tax=Edaphobacter aggregans TaxID=570835 RepID=A0A428MQ96_9BACT|nr:Ig-like domain repeat protein [Edaphobacter aggregans]RSL19040.1 Ig-like domain-containing protein [Edaphobacter aggregans]